MIYTTEEIPYPYYGMKSYRIEIDISNPRQHFQRHIWTHHAGVIEVGDWIPTSLYDKERLTKAKMFSINTGQVVAHFRSAGTYTSRKVKQGQNRFLNTHADGVRGS